MLYNISKQQRKVNETQKRFLEEINKIDNPQVDQERDKNKYWK